MCSTSATTESDVDRVAETARANLYLVLSRAFSSPVTMGPQDPAGLRLVTPDLSGRLQETARPLADAWEHGLLHEEALALAYARLFLGPFEILASPYASFYLQPDQQLMGPVSQSVAAVYAGAGLEPAPGPREAPDHVMLEWEFMYFVTHQHLVTGETSWLERRRAFMSTHVKRWMPSLADAMTRAGAHDFYDGLATLMIDALNEAGSCDGPADEDRR